MQQPNAIYAGLDERDQRIAQLERTLAKVETVLVDATKSTNGRIIDSRIMQALLLIEQAKKERKG